MSRQYSGRFGRDDALRHQGDACAFKSEGRLYARGADVFRHQRHEHSADPRLHHLPQDKPRLRQSVGYFAPHHICDAPLHRRGRSADEGIPQEEKAMKYVLPVLILLLFLYAFLFKKVKLYDAFTEGAGGAIPLAVKLFPFLAAIFLLTELFEASGLSKAVSDLLSPVFGIFGHSERAHQTGARQALFGQRLSGAGQRDLHRIRRGQLPGAVRLRYLRLQRNGLLHRRRLLCRHKFQASVKAHRHLPRRYVRLRRILPVLSASYCNRRVCTKIAQTRFLFLRIGCFFAQGVLQ